MKTVAHGGAWGGFRAQLIRVPEFRFSAVVLCNLGSSNPDEPARKLIDLYLAGFLEPQDEEAATEVVSGHRARYHNLTTSSHRGVRASCQVSQPHNLLPSVLRKGARL